MSAPPREERPAGEPGAQTVSRQDDSTVAVATDTGLRPTPMPWMFDADGELMKPALGLKAELRLNDAQWDGWWVVWESERQARSAGRGGIKFIGMGDPNQPRWRDVVDALVNLERIAETDQETAYRSEWIKYVGCIGCDSSGAFVRRDRASSGPRTYEAGQVRVSCGRRCRTRDVLTELGIDTIPEPTVIEAGGDGERNPFDGAGEGLSDAMLCAEVAQQVLDRRYRWARGLGWIMWTGKRWTRTPDQAVHEAVRRYLLDEWRHAVKQLAKANSDAERKTGEALVSAWRGTLNRGRIGAIASLAQGITGILTEAGDLDRHPDLLNVGNGVIHLPTRELRSHDPDLLLMMCSPVDYQPDATHPDWTATLEAIPEDVRPWTQIRYGQGITGYMTPDDLMVVHDGGGENGKTTVAAGIRGALGDYYTQISHRALLGDPSQHPTELMSFRAARVALLEELPEERRLNVTRLKAVVGTPQMKARLIRQDEIEFDATHSLFLNTNYLPVVDETDHGTWRRLARLRFPYTFLKPGQKPTRPGDRPGDPNLRQRLEEGRNGQHDAVLAWLVIGAGKWYAGDRIMPPLPERIAADTREWRGRSDLLMAYADDRLVFNLDRHVMTLELLDDFNGWLKAHGHREWSDRTLSARIEEHGEFQAHDVAKTSQRRNIDKLSRRDSAFTAAARVYKAWVGLRFRTDDDDMPSSGDSQNRRSDEGVTAVTAGSDKRHTRSLARVNQTIGYSGYTCRRCGAGITADRAASNTCCGLCAAELRANQPTRPRPADDLDTAVQAITDAGLLPEPDGREPCDHGVYATWCPQCREETPHDLPPLT